MNMKSEVLSHHLFSLSFFFLFKFLFSFIVFFITVIERRTYLSPGKQTGAFWLIFFSYVVVS